MSDSPARFARGKTNEDVRFVRVRVAGVKERTRLAAVGAGINVMSSKGDRSGIDVWDSPIKYHPNLMGARKTQT